MHTCKLQTMLGCCHNMNSPVYSFDSAEQRGLSATNEKERSHVEPVTVEGLGLTAKLFVCLAGDLHFYMRHSFRPAPAPMKASGKVANGHVDDFSDSNPLAESAPSRLAAAKILGARNASVSGSSVASSEADEAELGRDIYRDLASLVHNGKRSR